MEQAKLKPDGPAVDGPKTSPNLLAFTIDIETGQILKLEKVDSTGAHLELSDDETASLAASKGAPSLEAMIEQAFEAGFSCLLDQRQERVRARDRDAEESDLERELRRTLLLSLIEKTPAQHLLDRNLLSRAILRTAIEQTMRGRKPASEDGSIRKVPSSAAAKAQPSHAARP